MRYGAFKRKFRPSWGLSTRGLLYKALGLSLGLAWGLSMPLIAQEAPKTAYKSILELVDAIYKAEGAEKAAVPYGLIYSGWCQREPGWCKYYAAEIVAVSYTRWHLKGRPGEFIDWLGSTYAPPSAHPLNRNWAGNVKRFYKASSGSAQFEIEETSITAVNAVRG